MDLKEIIVSIIRCFELIATIFLPIIIYYLNTKNTLNKLQIELMEEIYCPQKDYESRPFKYIRMLEKSPFNKFMLRSKFMKHKGNLYHVVNHIIIILSEEFEVENNSILREIYHNARTNNLGISDAYLLYFYLRYHSSLKNGKYKDIFTRKEEQYNRLKNKEYFNKDEFNIDWDNIIEKVKTFENETQFFNHLNDILSYYINVKTNTFDPLYNNYVLKYYVKLLKERLNKSKDGLLYFNDDYLYNERQIDNIYNDLFKYYKDYETTINELIDNKYSEQEKNEASSFFKVKERMDEIEDLIRDIDKSYN